MKKKATRSLVGEDFTTHPAQRPFLHPSTFGLFLTPR
jgi:hypothetical protein